MGPVVAGFLSVLATIWFSMIVLFTLVLAFQFWPLTVFLVVLFLYVRRGRGCNRGVSVL